MDGRKRLLNFMTQPFSVSEVFTGKKGAYVYIPELLDGVEAVLNGQYDKTKPSDFLYDRGRPLN